MMGGCIANLPRQKIQQIGGHAGRYGLSSAGEVGAIDPKNLTLIRKLFETEAPPLSFARVAPSVQDLELLPGSLADRLRQWATLNSIPDNLRGKIKTADMTERIELAAMLNDQEVAQLGLATALKLVNAPTRRGKRQYWRLCANAILSDRSISLPLPPSPPQRIDDSAELERTETCIHCADVYLWLGQRPEFSYAASDERRIRQLRAEWSLLIDVALQHKIASRRRCTRCGATLPKAHAYPICDNCYYNGRFGYDDYGDDEDYFFKGAL